MMYLWFIEDLTSPDSPSWPLAKYEPRTDKFEWAPGEPRFKIPEPSPGLSPEEEKLLLDSCLELEEDSKDSDETVLADLESLGVDVAQSRKDFGVLLDRLEHQAMLAEVFASLPSALSSGVRFDGPFTSIVEGKPF